jgi:SNF2 family DNA or RNA helicase
MKFVHRSAETYSKADVAPLLRNDNQLSESELEDFNFLVFSWSHQRNCILIGEPGVCQKAQVIAFLHFIFNVHHLSGPFLIVASLGTLVDWQRTFAELTYFNAIVYMGNAQALEIIHKYEFYFPDKSGPKFDVIITSYELLRTNLDIFTEFTYNVVIADESAKLMGTYSELRSSLAELSSEFRILLNCTPLENTVNELQSILGFLHSGDFTDITDLDRLKDALEPHLFHSSNRTVSQPEESVTECQLTLEGATLFPVPVEKEKQ